VVVDQPGVRGGVGGRAQVVVRDPVQPCTGKRRVGFVGDRGEPDVASFGDQQRRQRLGQARLARLGVGHVGVFVEEPGPAVHFEGQVGDLHLWQEPFHLAAQGDQ